MRLPSRHRLWQVGADGLLVALAWYLAFQVRFDQGVQPRYDQFLGSKSSSSSSPYSFVFVVFGLYEHWWRYVSIRDIWRTILAVSVAALWSWSSSTSGDPLDGSRVPRGVVAIDWLLVLAFVTGARLLARTLIERPGARPLVARGKEVLVVGAGDAGQLVVREMLKTPAARLHADRPRRRRPAQEEHAPARGPGARDDRDLPRLLAENRPDEVIIAIPSAAGDVRQAVVNACRDASVPVKTLPGVHELIAGDLALSQQLREVQVEDVLGREAIELDVPSVASYISGATVLVTGAGGSIGSELCRQVAALGAERRARRPLRERARRDRARAPARARLHVDGARPGRRPGPGQDPAPVRAPSARRSSSTPPPTSTCRSWRRTRSSRSATTSSARRWSPRSPPSTACEALRPRLDRQGGPARRTSSARRRRLRVDRRDGRRAATATARSFIAVRFGNVLGSSGSVIPLFRRQIARGGPVTVTHPDMERYFMTIPEAVQLDPPGRRARARAATSSSSTWASR